jgi:hypothetical protein
MSTSLENCEILLSKDLRDYWASTSTSDGDAGGTTIVDTALQAKGGDWITDEAYDMITSGTYDEEERKISSLSTSTLTTLAHGGKIASGVTYRIHRLFSASDKRRALVEAVKDAYPAIHKKIYDETKTSGTMERNGCVTVWTSSSYPDYWRVSGVTATENTTAPYYKRTKSCKLDTATGYLYTNNTLVPDLEYLAGHSATFSAQVWCDTADAVRLGILYDGTNLSYSSYHGGGSDWTEDNDPLEVTQAINATPTSIEFRVYLASASATAYISDLRIRGPIYNKVYVGDLDFVKNEPDAIWMEPSNYSTAEPWIPVRNWTLDKDGWLHIPDTGLKRRLRMEGMGYLDFLDTNGDVGTDWADTIDIDSPQTKILSAQAIIWLCNQMILPNYDSPETERWEKALNYWQRELDKRIKRYSMTLNPIHAKWSC